MVPAMGPGPGIEVNLGVNVMLQLTLLSDWPNGVTLKVETLVAMALAQLVQAAPEAHTAELVPTWRIKLPPLW